MAPLNEKILRAGLYERVSTTEQAMKGYSIEAQKDCLEEYCNNNKIKIVDHYTDEGISGSKPPLKRPQLKRLLEDVEAGKIDIIIFTKLDRWFRNVQEYFKVQEILDKHNVSWKTIFEDYNTDTADGRLKVNIMLSVAANERERTSERTKVVFEHKRKNKEAFFAKIPLGYIKEKDSNGTKRLVKDPETQDIMNEFWDLAIKTNQIRSTVRYLQNKYNIQRSLKAWYNIARNELYTGESRGIKNFCEPYIDRKKWEQFLSARPIKQTQQNRCYLFTGLIKCPSCGKLLSSGYSVSRGNEFNRYKCNDYGMDKCDFRYMIYEKSFEQALLTRLPQLIEDEIAILEAEKSKPKSKPKTNIKTLQEKLRRLNVTYMAGNKSDDEYLQEQKELKQLIAKAEKEELPQERDFTPLKKVLESDILNLYSTLTTERKRRLWRSIIKEIKVEGTQIKEVVFL